MPQIVIIIDELADLMMVASNDVEGPSVVLHSLPVRRAPSDPCYPATQRGCHHGTDQGKYAVKNCIFSFIGSGFAYDH